MYIEKIFPAKNIRYIAVNDHIDTFDKKNSNNDITPFKAVINDMYAKDTSNKVRSTIFTKAIGGECIKAFLPYGYKKDANNKNKILVDKNVAENVKLIFDYYKQGRSKTEIARKLNDMEIETPLTYKKQNSNYYNPNSNVTYQWNSTMINKILRNQIYVGDLVQLQYNKVNYKIKKIAKVPKEEQIAIYNNHEPIIDRNTFNMVQEMLDKQTNEWNYTNRKRHLLAGLVYCKCGSRITYNKNHGKVFRCVCSSYKKYGKRFCSNVHLKEAELIDMVAFVLRKNIAEYLQMENLEYPTENIKSNIQQDLEKLTKKKEKMDTTISKLYEDKMAGVISLETFKMLIEKYEKKRKAIEKEISAIPKNREEKKKLNPKQLEDTMRELLKFDAITEENKSLVFKLINKIIIDDDKIEIQYKFTKTTII